MGADPLSDLLRAVRLQGAVFFHLEARDRWVAEASGASRIAHRIMPGAQHVIEWHAVIRGACYGGLLGERPERLDAGDVIVFPHGDAHALSSAPGLDAAPLLDVPRWSPDQRLPFRVKRGAGAPEVEILCGFLGCDVRPFNPLLPTLPRVLRARDPGGGEGPLRHLVQLTLAEAERSGLGGESMLARLSELMFVEVLRRHLETLPADRRGWLAGLRDEFVGKALALLHGQPARPWTLELLAREVGLSRSALAERFARYTGEPPMQYLARWRMQVATRLLERGEQIAGVAADVGYASEAAFSRAFKKLVGAPPATWRRRALPAPEPDGGRTTVSG